MIDTNRDYTRFLSPVAVATMLEAQEKTNFLYGGYAWKKDTGVPAFLLATADEFSEFLREVKPVWKWWDRNAQTNLSAARVELIDATHFMLSVLLLRGVTPEGIKNQHEACSLQDICTHAATRVKWVNNRTLDRMNNKELGAELIYRNSEFNRIALDEKARPQDLVRAFLEFHAVGFHIVGLTAHEGFEVYVKKNQVCHERVNNGLLEGVDVKSMEKPLEV